MQYLKFSDNVSDSTKFQIKGKPFPKVDFASVPLIGPAAFYVLKELKYLT